MTDDPQDRPGKPPRLLSLDAVRGLTVAGMIVVNDPGAWGEVYQFAPLRHADWHGCTPTDLVFPFFLFLVGVAIPFSLSGRTAAGAPVRIFRRAAVLFALGLLLRAYPRFDLAGMRIPGVLPRIAVVYLFAALLAARTGWRGQALTAAGLLLGYWALLALAPVPGGRAGVLEKEGNLAAWVDVAVLGGHLYEPAFDPEGILSTLPAIATALLGCLAGHRLRSEGRPEGKTAALLAAGLAAAAAGWLWGRVFPINKQLWTSSYSLHTAGLASVVLGLAYGLADARGIRAWAKPFAVFGANAIGAFVLATLLAKTLSYIPVEGPAGQAVSAKTWLWREVFAPLGPPKAASLAYALAFTALVWLAMLPLFRRRIFLRA